MAVEDLIKTVMEELKNIAQTGVHIGKPIEVGETHVIPVSRISMGFGAGGFGMESEGRTGRGTGGGVSVDPVAFLVIRDQDIQLLHLQAPGSPVGKLVELIPEVIAQIKTRREHGDRED